MASTTHATIFDPWPLAQLIPLKNKPPPSPTKCIRLWTASGAGKTVLDASDRPSSHLVHNLLEADDGLLDELPHGEVAVPARDEHRGAVEDDLNPHLVSLRLPQRVVSRQQRGVMAVASSSVSLLLLHSR